MNIRSEKTEDYQELYQLHYVAFGNRVDESKLVDRIRASEEYVPDLSLVYEEEGRVLGHALFSKAVIREGEQQHEVIVLAPIAVEPQSQRNGIGSRLIAEGAKRCEALGYELVLLIGHPDYYPKHGFVPARQYGLELTQFPVPDEVFMVRELVQGALGRIRGELQYPSSFFTN